MPDLADREQEALYTIRAYTREKPAVSFSGGKDSLVALHLAIRASVDRAVFCNTTIEFDDTIQYVKRVGETFGITMDIIKPPRSFSDLVPTLGLPSRRARWCCKVFKFGPLGKYAVENRLTAFITGLRSEESHQRRTYGVYSKKIPLIPVPQVNPLIEWSEEDVWNYIEKYSLPVNPLYRKADFSRVGCWLCPYKSDHDWEKTKKYFPDLMTNLKPLIIGSAGAESVDDLREMAWTSYLYLQTSKIKGEITANGDDAVLSLDDWRDFQKVLKLAPQFKHRLEKICEDNKLVFKSFSDVNRLKLMAERALNCIGCGACMATCKANALYLDEGQITVNDSTCTGCGQCLKSSNTAIRGACIRRNYAPLRYEIKGLDSKTDKRDSARVRELCGGSKLSLIRTRVPMNDLAIAFSKSFDTRPIGNILIAHGSFFTVIGKKRNGMTELLIRTDHAEIHEAVSMVRQAIAPVSGKWRTNRMGEPHDSIMTD